MQITLSLTQRTRDNSTVSADAYLDLRALCGGCGGDAHVLVLLFSSQPASERSCFSVSCCSAARPLLSRADPYHLNAL